MLIHTYKKIAWYLLLDWHRILNWVVWNWWIFYSSQFIYELLIAIYCVSLFIPIEFLIFHSFHKNNIDLLQFLSFDCLKINLKGNHWYSLLCSSLSSEKKETKMAWMYTARDDQLNIWLRVNSSIKRYSVVRHKMIQISFPTNVQLDASR